MPTEYHVCANCGESEATIDLNDCAGRWLCIVCAANADFCQCAGCSNHFQRSGMMPGDYWDSGMYCPDCWDIIYCSCDACGRVIRLADFIRQNGGIYCEDCASSEDDSYDDDEYSDESYWNAKSFSPTTNTFNRIGDRAYGVEVETHSCHNYEGLNNKKGYRYWGAKRW